MLVSDPFRTAGEAIAWIASRNEFLTSWARDESLLRIQLKIELEKQRSEHAIFAPVFHPDIEGDAVTQLAWACAASRVQATGLRGGTGNRNLGLREHMGPLDWTDLTLDDGTEGVIAKPRPASGSSTWWYDLRFKREDIISAFPKAEVAALSTPECGEGEHLPERGSEHIRGTRSTLGRSRSGAPGRPSSMHLVRNEFQRRLKTGTIEPSLALEADALSLWIRLNHPDEPQLTAKAIQNKLRPEYREANKSRK